MDKKGFFDVPRAPVQTSEGPFDLPALYYDVSVRQLVFWVDYTKALPKLAGTGLAPIELQNGKTMAILIFYNYRKVQDVEPYEEIALAIPAELQSAKKGARKLRTFFGIPLIPSGITGYVLELPVTTAQARAGGRELWGYPKFLTRLPFKFYGTGFEFGALDPEGSEPIFTVKSDLGKGRGLGQKGSDMVTLSNLNGKILRTVINIDAKFRVFLKRQVEIKIGTVKHRFADNLRDLGLEGTQTAIIMCTDAFRSRLNKGEPVADWPTPPMPYPVTK
jgi:hypothetical protein